MIDREKLAELIGDAPVWHNGTKGEVCTQIADFLLTNGVTFATDTNVGSKWISVEDRLPEADMIGLAIVSGKPTSNITLKNAYELAEYDPEGWILEMWPEWMDAEVSYWMPLPEPPKEGQHD